MKKKKKKKESKPKNSICFRDSPSFFAPVVNDELFKKCAVLERGSNSLFSLLYYFFSIN